MDAAQREVEAARDDVARQEADQAAASAKRVEVAKAAVAALPPPQSATPLADYTGVPEWMLDVFEALTISFAINLPASALVALGVKLGRPRLQIQEATERTITIEAMPSEAEREPEALLPAVWAGDASAGAERKVGTRRSSRSLHRVVPGERQRSTSDQRYRPGSG